MRLPASVLLATAGFTAFLILPATAAAPATPLQMSTCLASATCPTHVAERRKITSKTPNSLRGPKTIRPAPLTAQECERLGGAVTGNGDPTCKTNSRCKMTLPNGDLRSVCIDEVK